MEVDGDGRVTKNSYGVFNLSWQAAQHPEWADTVALELAEIRGRIKDAHGAPLQYLIWAGMGGSAEDKSMYNAVGLLKRAPRCYVSGLDRSGEAEVDSGRHRARSKLDLREALKRTLVVGMAMGMTSYEPVVNLEKIAALYDNYGIDSTANFVYMTLPGIAAGSVRVQARLPQDRTATRQCKQHGGAAQRSFDARQFVSARVVRSGSRGVDPRTQLSPEQIATAFRLRRFCTRRARLGATR
jgi:hypothetical protein